MASRTSKASVRKARKATKAPKATKARKAPKATRAKKATTTKALKATRATKAPRSPKSLTAGDVPVTRSMLGALRTELLERIDQAREESRIGIARLDAKIDAVRAELKAEIAEVKAELHAVKAELHEVKASIARIEFLVEEQNARNKIVLDAITAMLDWRKQVDQRLDDVEQTVRSLAAARPVREPA